MPALNYDAIEPNIAEVDINGPTVEVTWKCPVSGKVIGSSEAVMQPSISASNQVKTSVKRTVVNEVIQFLNNTVVSMIGGSAGRVARAATSAARTGIDRKVSKPKFDEETEHAAVVVAFRKVMDRFDWDEDRELYVANGR